MNKKVNERKKEKKKQEITKWLKALLLDLKHLQNDKWIIRQWVNLFFIFAFSLVVFSFPFCFFSALIIKSWTTIFTIKQFKTLLLFTWAIRYGFVQIQLIDFASCFCSLRVFLFCLFPLFAHGITDSAMISRKEKKGENSLDSRLAWY